MPPPAVERGPVRVKQLNLDAVGYEIEPLVATWSSKDALLYAVAVGCGTKELQFCTENSRRHAQRVLPTFAALVHDTATECLSVLGEFPPGCLLHAMERLTLNRELEPEGSALIRGGVSSVFDKGSAALISIWTSATDVNGSPLFRREMSIFAQGFGGWGGERGPKSETKPILQRPADRVVKYETRPEQALLYRLTGDRNPLHSDPSVAVANGFDRPILHGMCTFGFTGRGLLHSLCDGVPARFRHMEGRFSGPMWPGDSLAISIWKTGPGDARFEATSGDRSVIDQGVCTFEPSG